MPEVIKVHAQQFMLGELLPAFNSESIPSLNEVDYALMLSLLRLDKF